MSITHTLNAFSKGGVTGCQIQQRDWSPYLVHFTSCNAMIHLRKAFDPQPAPGLSSSDLPKQINKWLVHADASSFVTFQSIMQKGEITKHRPDKKKIMPKCVCLAECNLPGLISHAERYGRFGLVFKKLDLYRSLEARPCLYMDKRMHDFVKDCKDNDPGLQRKLFGLSNIYNPQRPTRQDFTHEREWRVFQNLPLFGYLKAILCPQQYMEKVSCELDNWAKCEMAKPEHKRVATFSISKIPVIPIDMLFEWGA